MSTNMSFTDHETVIPADWLNFVNTVVNNQLDLTGYQPLLVSGTNIKTFNGVTLLGSGDVTYSYTPVSGTDIKTINNTSLVGAGNVSVQAVLVSGTNIKTFNGVTLLGSGDITYSYTPVSGTDIKTINSTSLVGSGNVSVQPVLVSGTNIKSINGTSLLGTGDITIGDGTGSVTSVSVTTANGFSGSVTNPTTTPAITLTTSVTGIVKGTGTGITAAVAADFPTLNQNTTGSAATLTTPRTIGGVSFDGSANITQPFDVHAFYAGTPTASAKVLRVPIARAVTFPANFAGSYGKASAASSGTAVFDVQKNGVSIGSITFTSSATATFTSSSGAAQTFAAGDVLSIIAPGSADASLSDVGFVLAGTR